MFDYPIAYHSFIELQCSGCHSVIKYCSMITSSTSIMCFGSFKNFRRHRSSKHQVYSIHRLWGNYNQYANAPTRAIIHIRSNVSWAAPPVEPKLTMPFIMPFIIEIFRNTLSPTANSKALRLSSA